MKKSLLILTTFLSVSSFSYANNLPVAYKQALNDLDIVGAELQGDFLSAQLNCSASVFLLFANTGDEIIKSEERIKINNFIF